MKRLLILIALSILPNILIAQGSSAIKGFVYVSGSGEPMPNVTVSLAGKGLSTTTDNNGYFAITKLPAGKYKIIVSAIGYQSETQNINLGKNTTKNNTFYLNIEALDVVKVTGEDEAKRTDVQISTITLTPKEIENIPSVGAPDLVQALSVQAGIVTTGDQGGQLYIRGGPPIQNKVLLDGAIIYNPFHSIGLFSVFDTDILRSADIYTGGFGAQYGGRISSIMDITTRDGNKSRFAGKISVSPFTASGTFEGPIVKLDEEEGGTSASFLLNARGSFLSYSSPVIYPYAQSLPYNFYDIYGKVSVNAGNYGSKVSLFGFSFNDQVNFSDITNLNWRAFGGGLNFIVVPREANLRIDGVFSYSSYKINFAEANNPPRTSKINGFNLGLNFHQFFKLQKIVYGLAVIGYSTDFRYFNAINREISQEANTTQFAAFLRAKLLKWGFVFDPGFRIQYYADLNNFSAEPRLRIKYNITPWLRIKVAGGLYSQNLIAANSDRDVVNLFYGFLSGSDELPDNFQGEPVTHKLQKAQHAIAGFEIDASKYVNINLEGYFINFSQLINLNRNKLFEDNGQNSEVPDNLKKDFIIEKGYATGIDATVKFNYKSFMFSAVYSYMYLIREDETMEYKPHFTRNHNVNLLAVYRFGKNNSWTVSARFNFGSGFPFTQTVGFYEKLNFQDGIQTDYTSNNGQLDIKYGQLNQGQLPYYHRLDISVKKEISFKKHMKLIVRAGASNVYNRKNIFYINRITNQRVDQLPIIPTVGLSFEF